MQKVLLDCSLALVHGSSQMQQFWLRQQNELVRKTRSMDDQTSAIDSLKKQLLILNQKKLRTDGTVVWINRELIFMHSNQRVYYMFT